MRLGYACISVGINEGVKNKDKVMVNRGMIKRTFETKGLKYVSELTILNLLDLKKILKYNLGKNIYVYRMSSDMFPCIGFYKISDLPDFNKIKSILKEIGSYIISNSIRVSFHPSHFCVLASENDGVVEKTIDELDKHSEIMDLMGLEASDYYPINIHVGTTKPSLSGAMNKFCKNFQRLSETCKKRLVVENDDSPSQYSIKILYDGIYKNIKTPLTFDQFHFLYGPQDQTMEEALRLAASTWKTKQLTHMSSSRKVEDKSSKETAHADFIYDRIENYGLSFDVEIEAKAKDLALIDYIKKFGLKS